MCNDCKICHELNMKNRRLRSEIAATTTRLREVQTELDSYKTEYDKRIQSKKL